NVEPHGFKTLSLSFSRSEKAWQNVRTLVLIPVYNEWPHLLPVLKDLRRQFSDMLVVDDGSDDKSFLSHLRDNGFEYLSFPFNLGHWSAIQAGFRYALKKGFDGVITFDGDGQHLPEGALKIAPYIEQGYDLVIGSDNDRGNFPKKVCWKILNRLSGLEIQDFTSGLRGYSQSAMEKLICGPFLNLHYQDLGVLFIAQKMGLRIIEVPVRMRDRLGEKSKVFPTIASVIKYILITLTFILARRP
ncbi:MAG: glycosyltransferase family 2 protein, partial [Proteobacteria bacterium]|nr:glycosyltransferase family 2 protein [Pseudomonadota bacterium]